MKKTARRRPTKAQLALARSRVRMMREILSARPEPHSTGRFIQCWAVSGRPVTQALDDTGQVWERVWRKATATEPESSWWEPLPMERRDKKQESK